MSHVNDGSCVHCWQIINKYPNFNQDLSDWFLSFQDKNPEAHVSCAGRGREDQMQLFSVGSTKAVFGQSAHNWNAALDIFCMVPGSQDIYDANWFKNIFAPSLPDWVTWYGRPGAPFHEFPHIELSNWNDLAHTGKLSKVEA